MVVLVLMQDTHKEEFVQFVCVCVDRKAMYYVKAMSLLWL